MSKLTHNETDVREEITYLGCGSDEQVDALPVDEARDDDDGY